MMLFPDKKENAIEWMAFMCEVGVINKRIAVLVGLPWSEGGEPCCSGSA